MMNFNFDLISDLHVETWSEEIDWTGIATSPVCVVVGDISKDRNIVTKVLTKLGQCYQAVFYIDGNDEHHDYLHTLGYSYADLVSRVNNIPNVVYLQDNVVVIDGVAILGTNGWWGFDFDLGIDYIGCQEWYREKFGLTAEATHAISVSYTHLTLPTICSV